MLAGCADWQPPPRQLSLRRGVRLLALPAVFGVASLGVLVYAGFHHVGAVGVVLASAAVLLVIARATWTFPRERTAVGGLTIGTR